MKNNTVKVKALIYKEAGKASWETIKHFETAAEADAWLTKFIKDNNADNRDFTISRK